MKLRGWYTICLVADGKTNGRFYCTREAGHEGPCAARPRLRGWKPDVGWKWWKWTFGFWHDYQNHTFLGFDIGPLEIVWRYNGYRP